jgi:hypothetical protein
VAEVLTPEGPLYAWLLGPRYQILPAIVREMHDVGARVTAEGISTVNHGKSWLAQLMARLLRLPRAGGARRVRVSLERRGALEVWARQYDDAILTTHQMAAGPAGSALLGERFGPLTVIMRLEPSSTALLFVIENARWFGLSVPGFLRPRVRARAFAADGWYRFDVTIALPLVGLLIRYDGRLKMIAAEP